MLTQIPFSLHMIGWVAIGILVLIGAALLISARGYRFTGGICLGVSAVILCCILLDHLAKQNRQAAIILGVIFIALLAFGSIAAFITGCIIAKASRGNPENPYDYIVVLGAGVAGTEPSVCLLERLEAAYQYLIRHRHAICIASGGQGKWEFIPEGQCIFDELTARGIEAERIWVEDRSSSTRENIRFSLDLIQSRTGKRPEKIGLVSNEYHLYRAAMFARQQNITAYGIPAKTGWLPLYLNYFLREIVAVWYFSMIWRLRNAKIR